MTVHALPFRPPYDGTRLAAFLSDHASPGVETVAGGGYRRTFRFGGGFGILHVEPAAKEPALRVRLDAPGLDNAARDAALARLRTMFDLDADPTAISDGLGDDPFMADLVRRRPGLRIPGAFDPFELTVRAILGQQVSVAAATRLAGGWWPPSARRSPGKSPRPADPRLPRAGAARRCGRVAHPQHAARPRIGDPTTRRHRSRCARPVGAGARSRGERGAAHGASRHRPLDGALRRHAGAGPGRRIPAGRCRPDARPRCRSRTPESRRAAGAGRGVASVAGLRRAPSLGGGCGSPRCDSRTDLISFKHLVKIARPHGRSGTASVNVPFTMGRAHSAERRGSHDPTSRP